MEAPKKSLSANALSPLASNVFSFWEYAFEETKKNERMNRIEYR